MRTGLLMLLMALSAVAAFAQPSALETDAGLAIIKYSWLKELLNWDDAETITPAGVTMKTRDRKPPGLRRKEASEQRSRRANSSGARQTAEDPRYQFTYNLVVRNDSLKKIREIDWDYVFSDAQTREELGRRQFTSAEKVDRGKTKKLTIRVSSPPTLKIDVYRMGKKESDGLKGTVEISRILYDDDSEWKAPAFLK